MVLLPYLLERTVTIRIGNYLLFKEKAGVISLSDIYVFYDFNGAWLYTHESLWGLLKQIIFEWRHDRHIVG
jgi:hypothetical protein